MMPVLFNLLAVLSLLDPVPSGSLDFSSLITALTGAVSGQQIITYMAAIVGAGIGLYVAYVFGRKAVRAFASAIRGGRPTI